MPPKAPVKVAAGGKKTAKELEAEQKEAERNAFITQVKEENRKFGIKQLFPGLDLVLTEYVVENAWNHPSPKCYVKECIYQQLGRCDAAQHFKLSEIEAMSNFLVYAMIFAKHQLGVSNFKTSVLVNLNWNLFKYDDERFLNMNVPYWDESKLDGLDDVQNLEEWAKENLQSGGKGVVSVPTEDSEEAAKLDVAGFKKTKNYQADLKQFRNHVKELAYITRLAPNENGFEKEQLAKVIDYSFKSYFNFCDQFNCVGKYDQSEEEVYLKVNIDEPQTPKPLETAKYLGKIILEEERLRIAEQKRRDLEESQILKAEQKRKEEAERRAEEERWAGLDEKTIQMIKDKVSEARSNMMDKLEDRNQDYQEKLTNAKTAKGGKGGKGGK